MQTSDHPASFADSSPSLSGRLLALLSLLIAMSSIQGGASLAKSIFDSISPEGLTTLRLAFATLILFVFWRPWRTRIELPWQKVAPALLLYGVSLGAMNLLFYLALRKIPLGIAVAFEFIGPLAVALFLSRRLLDLLWVTCAVVGILFLLPIEGFSEHLDPIGVLLAVLAGVCWAGYIVFGNRVGRILPGGIATSWGMLVATLVVLPFGAMSAGPALLDSRIVPIALMVALLSSAVPYSLEMVALKKLPTRTFSVLMSLEPALAALSGLLFLNESLSVMQWSAIVLLVIASVGASAGASITESTSLSKREGT